MAARNPSSSFKLWSSMMMFYRHRIVLMRSSGRSNDTCSPSSILGSGIYGATSPSFRSLSSSTGSSSKNFDELNNRMNKEGGSTPNAPPLAPPATSRFSLLNWIKCLIGSALSILVPFWKLRWESLQRLEGEVEKVVEEVEEVVEVVEKVVIMTEKASAMVAEILPENCGVKQTALAMEDICETVVEDAEQTKRFINKVGDLKQDLECLETMIEPVIHKIIEMEHSEK